MNAKILLSTILISSLGLTLRGQTTTARLTGSVSDASGAAVPEAKITATHVATGTIRTANSGADGRYTIPLLERGGYQVSAQKQGFRPIVRELTLDVGQIARVDFALEVGEMTEKVTVTAQAPLLQTASAERSGVITGSQLDNLLIRSRSINAFLRLLPGVMDESESEVLGTGMNMNIAGNRNNTNNVALDGLMVMSIGSGTNHAALVSQDAVAEVKVLLTNYQAEYGRTSGANIQIVSKSGSREFHGLGSYFLRHEQFNANNFFNNRLGLAKSRYRYRTWTYNIGGPVYIPNKFNRNRDKLFFFWSQEGWPIKAPQGIRQLTVPTELERAGDFSQSLDLNGGLIPVTDPASGLPFPGNRVPAARLDRSGQSLLKFFPAANFFDRNISGGRYNYVFEAIMDNPIRTDTLKVDYHLNPRNILSGSFSFGSIKSTGSLGVSTLISNWPQMEGTFIIPRKILPVRYQRIFSPTLFNELYVGYLWNGARFDTIDERLQRNRRDTVGFAAGQLYSSSNPLKLVPNASFGGVPNAAILSFDGRFPFYDKQNALTLADNITKMAGAHTLKAGYYMDRIWTDRLSGANFNGSFSFGRDVNNPLETGYAYSNAALGVFGSYTEASKRPFNLWRVSNLEWFVQDNWKVTRRLTLDYGMRFAEVLPLIDQDDAMAGFAPQRYTPSRQPRLIAPTLAGGRRVGVHPSTGEIFPATVIGAIAPGTGDPANGMVVTAQDHSYPHALIRNRGIHYGPRFGFAYDLSGNGKTAVRGGFGIFYNRQNSDVLVSPFTTQLPLVDNPVVYYSTIANLGASPGFVFPQSVAGLDPEGHVPTATNFSLSVQREIGFGTVLDAGYVGSPLVISRRHSIALSVLNGHFPEVSI